MSNTVLYTVSNQVATVTLNKPKRRNAPLCTCEPGGFHNSVVVGGHQSRDIGDQISNTKVFFKLCTWHLLLREDEPSVQMLARCRK